MTVITEPGVYDDIPENDYHADPVPEGSLSVSGAKRLLPPHCPARFKWERDNGGRPNKREFDVGHAAHGLVLGTGNPVVVVDAKDWRTAEAKKQRDAAYAVGHVPVLAHEWRHVEGMAEALSNHHIAKDLFRPGQGTAEQSLFWRDEEHGVWRRARFDWFVGDAIIDYKSCDSAEREAIRRSTARFGYHQQDDWYREAATRVGLTPDPQFFFVFQEKAPPYIVTVVDLDYEARQAGWALNDRALRIYAECRRTGEWPGYATDVETISLPKWATYIEDAA